MNALIGLALAGLAWWALKLFANAKPGQVARLCRQAGGLAALGVAGLLGLRGRLDVALLVGGFGAYLLGWSALPQQLRAFARNRSSDTDVTRVTTKMLDVELDRGSGRITGAVLAGRYTGARLDQLKGVALLDLLREVRGADPQGVGPLEAYLDGRLPGWREAAQPDPNRTGQADPQLAAMTEQEAYEVLGLQPGAGADEIRRTHRQLMKRFHPDGGGSTWFASRINVAKDVLLDRHR